MFDQVDRLSKKLPLTLSSMRSYKSSLTVLRRSLLTADVPCLTRTFRRRRARRIAEARAEAGMTQQAVARALERGQGWVSDTEAGERRVEAAELFAFAEVLGKAPGWFVRPATGEEKVWLATVRADLHRSRGRANG